MEEAGISTVVIQQIPEITQRVKPPRSVRLKFPFGQAFGEPDNRNQQRAVIKECLKLLVSANQGSAIAEPGFRWRRENYAEVRFDDLSS